MGVLLWILLILAILALLPYALPIGALLLALCTAVLAFIAWLIFATIGGILKKIGRGLSRIGRMLKGTR